MTLRRPGPPRATVGGLFGAPGPHAFLCREFHSPTSTGRVIAEHRNVQQEGLPGLTPSFRVPVRWGGGLSSPPCEILMTPPRGQNYRHWHVGGGRWGAASVGPQAPVNGCTSRTRGPQEPGPAIKPSAHLHGARCPFPRPDLCWPLAPGAPGNRQRRSRF